MLGWTRFTRQTGEVVTVSAAIVWIGEVPIRTPGKKDKPSHVAGLWKAD